MKEEWRDVTGYKGFYQVSNLGNVKRVGYDYIDSRGRRRLKLDRQLKPNKLKNSNYLYVILSKKGVKKHHYIHRLVCFAFLPTIHDKNDVNHIDENPFNNNVSNLEWSTRKENINHGTAIKRRAQKAINGKQSRKVIQKTLNGVLVRVWPSASECGRSGFAKSSIVHCCLGNTKSYRGYKWEYAA